MKRRTLVRAGLAASVAALTGCIEASGSVGGPVYGNGTDGNATNGNQTNGSETSGNQTEGDGPAGDGPMLQEPTFEVVNAGCGVQRSAATVRRDEAAGAIVVEGTISAPNACYTASLDEAVYGAKTDSVWVDVVTEERDDAQVCAQCITEIDYRVRLPFEGGLPGRVAVTHDGTLVCPGGQANGQASGPTDGNSSG